MRICPAKAFTLPLLLLSALAVALFVSACQQPASNTNTNTASANVNTNTANANTNASPSTTDSDAGIETKEPDRYRATVTLTAEATSNGGNAPNIPKLQADVARDGDSRRISFKLPNGEPIIYLDKPDKRYAILPNRKQYAELTQEALGFDIARLMTPGQMVQYLKQQRGYQRVGEEQMDGRTVTRYRYAGTAQTGTAAGDVHAETFVYVDKDTGLPLRSELSSEASGNVQGVKGLKMVAVMSDISTDVDPSQFEVPQGLSKVDPQQVRQQVDAFVAIARVFLMNMVNAQQQQGGGNSGGGGSTPSASVSPSPAPSRASTPVNP